MPKLTRFERVKKLREAEEARPPGPFGQTEKQRRLDSLDMEMSKEALNPTDRASRPDVFNDEAIRREREKLRRQKGK